MKRFNYIKQMSPKRPILVIDDDKYVRKALSLILKQAGYEWVEMADTAEKGVHLAKSLNPSVIVLDVVLPVENGIDVCKRIKGIEGIDSKIIIMTAYMDEVNAVKARACGADEILVKPDVLDELCPTIKRILK